MEEAGAADTPSRAAPFVTGLQHGTPQKILEEMVLLIKQRERQRKGGKEQRKRECEEAWKGGEEG